MTEYITKGQAVDAAYRAIHYGFNDVHKAMMEGKDLKVNADNFYYTLLENVRAEIAVALPDDVVEVVRCKDCRHKQVDEIIFALSANPETALFCKRMGGIISETFYCAAGERMDGD